MSATLPIEEARRLAEAYLLMEQSAVYYAQAGYPKFAQYMITAMRHIGVMFNSGGYLKHGSRGGSRQSRIRTLALSLVETPKGV